MDPKIPWKGVANNFNVF